MKVTKRTRKLSEVKPKVSRRPKQSDLPGMEDRRLDELHDAAEQYLDAKDNAKKAADQRKGAEHGLVATMKRHGKTVYRFNRLEITVKPKDDGVTVKDKDREAEEANVAV